MKKGIVAALVVLVASFGMNSAMAEGKIAVIDIPAVVAKSAQVQALKKEQQDKMKELDNWLKVAQADVDKQKTQEGKEKLLKKYNTDFAKKKETLVKNYQTKLREIDKNITDTISAQAKAKGYDMVITKGAVVYGGDDITADIQKVIK